MNASISNLTTIAADLNAAGKTVSFKRLPTRKPRKGETCMIWMCPDKGTPIRWCRTDSNTNAIADLVFGC